MRIENIGMPKNIPENPQRPGLSEGDMLIAEVTEIDGDRVLLKNQDGGAVFSAKLLADIHVAVGDYVETVVDEASGGRYVLRVVDISRQMPFATLTQMEADVQTLSQATRTQALLGTLAMLKNNPGADPKAAAFLSKHGLAGTAENIEAISQMAKNPSSVTALLLKVIDSLGADPKAAPQTGAAMLSADVESQTPPPLAAQSQGEGTRPLAQPVQNAEVVLQAGMNEAAQTVFPKQAGTIQENTAQSGSPVQNNADTVTRNNAVQTPVALNGAGKANARPNTQTFVQPGGESQMAQGTQGQAFAPTQVRDDAAAPDSMPQSAAGMGAPMTAVDGQTQAAPQTAQAVDTAAHNAAATPPLVDETSAAISQGQNTDDTVTEQIAKTVPDEDQGTPGKGITASQKDEHIVQKALNMFIQTDDADKLAVHLKKAVREMPDQLKELKLLLSDADNIVKESISSKFDQIEKQMSLMSDVKRFDCYQIPLQASTQQQTTAELYVYRYRGGKKDVDPDHILILLGLDTQYMGRVETLIKTSGKSLNIEFNLEDMRLGDEMKADATRLEQAVRQAGYQFAGVSVKQLAARTTVLNAQERFEKETDGSAGNLDIRI